MNVGQDTTLSDGDVAEKFVQFLVVTDGELQVTGDDTGLLVVTGSVTSQFENFSSQVFKNSGQVDGSTSTNTLSVVSFTEETVNTTNGELETSLLINRMVVVIVVWLEGGFGWFHKEVKR